MKKILTYLLGTQLVIAAIIFFANSGDNYNIEAKPLLSFDPNDAESVVIEDNEDNKITLSQSKGTWLVGDKGVKIDSDKLDTLLNALKAAELKWPVATTSASHERFEVEEDNFVRKVIINKEGDNTVFYLGSSPGFRKNYLRIDGDDAVFSLPINTYDAPAKLDQWFDKAQLSSGKLNQINGLDYTANLVNDQWQSSTPLEQGKTLDGNKLATLAASLNSLRVTDIAEEFPSEKVTQFSVKSNEMTYHYSLVNKGEDYLIKREDVDVAFKIYQTTYDQIIGALEKDKILASTAPASSLPAELQQQPNVDIEQLLAPQQ